MLYLFFHLISLMSFHKFYVSITEMEYKATEQVIELSTKTFVDDVEVAIEHHCNCSFSYDLASEKERYLHIETVLENDLRINEANPDVEIVGLEASGEVLVIYYSIAAQGKPTRLEFGFLMPYFEDQVNIVHHLTDEKTNSYYFKGSNQEKLRYD